MADFRITFDMDSLRRDVARIARLIPREAKPALRRSVDRSVRGLRVHIRQQLRTDTTLASASISRAFETMRTVVSADAVQGGVRVASGRKSLASYRLAPRRPTAQKGKPPARWKPLTYQIQRGGKTYTNAPREKGWSKLFAVRLRSGRLAVFSRSGPALDWETGPSAQFHVVAPDVSARHMRYARERFLRELDHELRFRLERAGRPR